jgi:hypothetical protein
MSKLKFENIVSESLATTLGVQALSDRPNQVSAYGEGGLKAGELKLRFDRFATRLAKAIAELQTKLNSKTATEYIPIDLDGAKEEVTLSDLIGYITSGTLAKEYLKMPKDATENAEMLPIASIIYLLQGDFADFTEKINTTLEIHQAAYERIITYLESGELGLAEEGEF